MIFFISLVFHGERKTTAHSVTLPANLSGEENLKKKKTLKGNKSKRDRDVEHLVAKVVCLFWNIQQQLLIGK